MAETAVAEIATTTATSTAIYNKNQKGSRRITAGPQHRPK